MLRDNDLAATLRRFSTAYPRQRAALEQAATNLSPALPLTPLLAQRHVEELLERAVRGQSACPPTRAELLQALSDTSLKVPLNDAATTLMATLFKECLPDVFDPGCGRSDTYEVKQVRKKLVATLKTKRASTVNADPQPFQPSLFG
ncbi:hypothetical protein BH24DEI2_BH24DEI2_24500 [soil metagenome]